MFNGSSSNRETSMDTYGIHLDLLNHRDLYDHYTVGIRRGRRGWVIDPLVTVPWITATLASVPPTGHSMEVLKDLVYMLGRLHGYEQYVRRHD